MNILILNWRDIKNPKSGGAELVTHEHAKAWTRHGHKVDWFASSFNNSKNVEHIDGITVIRRGTSLTVFCHAFLYYITFRKKYDVIIDEIHGIPFFTPLYVRKPKIAFIHEVAEDIWDYMYPFPINTIGRTLEKIYFKLYKNMKFWTDAHATIKDLERYGIKRSQCYAIPCPINNEIYQGKVLKEKHPTYIFVSRVVRMKGIEEVLNAFSRIHSQDPFSQLWIVGGGEQAYVNSLKKLAHELGVSENVTFYGFVDQNKKLELMRKAHVLLHASVKEGWGLVILEAASQHTPSVVYNNGSLSEVVKNGETGVVVKKNTSQMLADEASALISDPKRYSRYQANGIQWVSSIQWKDVTAQSLKLLTSL